MRFQFHEGRLAWSKPPLSLALVVKGNPGLSAAGSLYISSIYIFTLLLPFIQPPNWQSKIHHPHSPCRIPQQSCIRRQNGKVRSDHKMLPPSSGIRSLYFKYAGRKRANTSRDFYSRSPEAQNNRSYYRLIPDHTWENLHRRYQNPICKVSRRPPYGYSPVHISMTVPRRQTP